MSILKQAIEVAESESGDDFRLHSQRALHAIVRNGPRNPSRVVDSDKNNRFRIILPVSGGIDSTTLYFMAQHAGLPTLPIYVRDVGAAGVPAEKEALSRIGIKHDQVGLAVNWEQVGNEDSTEWIGRNLVYIAAAIESAKDADHWGQVWLGNHSGAGESDVCDAGDKGFDFVFMINKLIIDNDLPFTVTSPLIGMNKVDAVRWCLTNGYKNIYCAHSCYDTSVDYQCGRCWHCFQTFAAFLPYCVRPEQFPRGVDFSQVAWQGIERCRDMGGMIYSTKRLAPLIHAANRLTHYDFAPVLPLYPRVPPSY